MTRLARALGKLSRLIELLAVSPIVEPTARGRNGVLVQVSLNKPREVKIGEIKNVFFHDHHPIDRKAYPPKAQKYKQRSRQDNSDNFRAINKSVCPLHVLDIL